jgi:hypothetical protein
VTSQPPPGIIYQCPECETCYLGERRCPDCQLFCRRAGAGGLCPHCDEPVAISQLTRAGPDLTGQPPSSTITTP